VYRSLVTSATGLIVAIPAYVLYSFLASRAKNLIHDIERGGIEVINLIEDSRHQREIIAFTANDANAEASKASKNKRG